MTTPCAVNLLPGGADGAEHALIELARSACGQTVVSRQRVGYPFHLGKSLHVHGDPQGMPTLYLQSCSGGFFDGDDLRLRVTAGPGALAHITSAASTIAHGMGAAGARQSVCLDVEDGALLEYLPDPVVLFPRARLDLSLHIRIAPGARLVAGESFVQHDPAGKDGAFALLCSDTQIRDRSGILRVRDRFRIRGEDLARGRPGVNGDHTAQATLLVVGVTASTAALVEALRDAVSSVEGVHAAASALPNDAGAWARMLARDASAVRAALHAGWSATRAMITGRAPRRRRK